MEHAFRRILATATVTAALMLAGCHAPANGDAMASMELNVYDVPPARAEALNHALTSVLAGKAHVSTAMPGKLLVYAPHSAQASIGDAIKALAKPESATSTPAQVNVRFWLVDGEPGSGDDDPALKPLAGSLAALRQSMGFTHFHLEQATILRGSSSKSGQLVTLDGRYQRSFQFSEMTIHGDTVRLKLDYDDNGAHGLRALRTYLDIGFGQYVVLAQAPGSCPNTATGDTPMTCPDKPLMRLLVVRVDRLPATP